MKSRTTRVVNIIEVNSFYSPYVAREFAHLKISRATSVSFLVEFKKLGAYHLHQTLTKDRYFPLALFLFHHFLFELLTFELRWFCIKSQTLLKRVKWFCIWQNLDSCLLHMLYLCLDSSEQKSFFRGFAMLNALKILVLTWDCFET